MLYSTRRYEAFEREFRCEPGQGRVLVQNGYLFLYEDPVQASDPAAARARWEAAGTNVEMQRAAGLVDVELLTAAEVDARFVHVDAGRLIGATYCPTDGFLRPDVIYMEGFRRVEELGGVVRQNESVIGGVFDRSGDLVAVRTARDAEVHADLFIDATNAWSPRLCEALRAQVLEISALKRYLYFLQRGPSLTPAQLRDMPMTITPRRAYCRPENAEQLLLGWAHDSVAQDDFDWADQDTIEPEFFHKSGLENYGMALWMELADSMPRLMEFDGLRATTAGFYAVTPDHNPFLGFNPRQRRLLHAVGFSGHGAMMGPFTAAVTTEMALAGETLHGIELDGRSIDLEALRIGRVARHTEGMVI